VLTIPTLAFDLPGCPAGAEITPVEPDPVRTGEGSRRSFHAV
jgi:hypothetical protein